MIANLNTFFKNITKRPFYIFSFLALPFGLYLFDISNKFKRKNIAMLIYNKNLSVCPLTTHLPLKMVNKGINKQLIIKKQKKRLH